MHNIDELLQSSLTESQIVDKLLEGMFDVENRRELLTKAGSYLKQGGNFLLNKKIESHPVGKLATKLHSLSTNDALGNPTRRQFFKIAYNTIAQ